VVAIAMSEALDAQIAPLDKQLRAYARRQAGCRPLMAHYGIAELTSVAIVAELGDCRRFSSSRQAVRYGLIERPAQHGRALAGEVPRTAPLI
jgi:transposase